MALVLCPECQREVSSEAAACPQCGHPIKLDEATALRAWFFSTERGALRPAIARAVVLGSAWLFFFGLIAFSLPGYLPLFEKLEKKDDLPVLSGFVLSLFRWNESGQGLPFPTFVVLLIVADLGLARAAGSSKTGNFNYRLWYTTALFLAVLAWCAYMLGSLMPVFKFRASIGK